MKEKIKEPKKELIWATIFTCIFIVLFVVYAWVFFMVMNNAEERIVNLYDVYLSTSITIIAFYVAFNLCQWIGESINKIQEEYKKIK